MKQKHLFLLLVALLALFIALNYLDYQQKSAIENPKNQILLRKIGDELLKSSNDSTSKVLPIKMLSANEFQIRFENKFSFIPDSLVAIVQKNMGRSTFPREYSVNVLKCSSKEVNYGFLVSLNDKETIIPCIGRSMPSDCYIISIKFIPTNTIFFNNKILFFTLLLLVLSVLFWFISNRKKEKLSNEKEIFKNIQIGKYFFYYEQHYIMYEDIKIVLTAKESKLLYIFFTSPNEIIDRTILQKEVWENEGVIVTRSLDMFISKLRKKLNKDPLINIVNIHGIGYKLEINPNVTTSK
ncbi:MAG TPA: winged helix-turn-helix domain-containing protein [Flavobacterium sp.]|nr:winged helix-turn-helix domain-containing protein [Flavobacterium sp.]